MEKVVFCEKGMRIYEFLEKFDLVNEAFTAYGENKTNEKEEWDNQIIVKDLARNKEYVFNERELHIDLEFLWSEL